MMHKESLVCFCQDIKANVCTHSCILGERGDLYTIEGLSLLEEAGLTAGFGEAGPSGEKGRGSLSKNLYTKNILDT